MGFSVLGKGETVGNFGGWSVIATRVRGYGKCRFDCDRSKGEWMGEKRKL